MTSPTNRLRRAVEELPDHLAGNLHLPRQPEWMCQGCTSDVPWPCPAARTRLAEGYGSDRVGLSIYCGILLDVAAADLLGLPAEELFERFIAWTR